MSIEQMADFASNFRCKNVSLNVKIARLNNDRQKESAMTAGFKQLFQCGDFTDVVLVCAGQKFRAHRVVLAAASEVFRQGLAGQSPSQCRRLMDALIHDDSSRCSISNQGMTLEVRIADIANPEAVACMLDYLYKVDSAVWSEYNPRTQEINKDVLRLAQNFRLPGLTDYAARWLAKDLNTGNVVERLNICEEFGLALLREKIVEQLILNRAALAEVAYSPQIMTYPGLMQAMLQTAACVPDVLTPERTGNKRRLSKQAPTPKKTSRRN